MKARIEQKSELNKVNYISAYEWLKLKNFRVLYPERFVCSIYLDNFKMQSYYDTAEGICPRRKIRIRTYNNQIFEDSINKYTLETKLTSDFERFKKQQPIMDIENSLLHGIIDNQYGLCKPIIKISYSREYFILKKWRVTIDKNIKYSNFHDGSDFVFDDFFVLEIKTSIDQDTDVLRNFFNFPRSRFSKYQRGIEALKIMKNNLKK